MGLDEDYDVRNGLDSTWAEAKCDCFEHDKLSVSLKSGGILGHPSGWYFPRTVFHRVISLGI
jgi:hypothetical protein